MNSTCIINNDVENDFLLTIAIPTYKRFDLLREALSSVFALNFTIPVEVIIVDNDPNDSERAILEMEEFLDNKFKYYKNEVNYGMTGNWNRCLELGKGKLITLLHDDDLLCGNFPIEIESYLSSIETIDDFAMIGFSAEILDQRVSYSQGFSDKVYKICRQGLHYFRRIFSSKRIVSLSLQNHITLASYVATLGVVMNREKALAISGYSNDWYPTIDNEFYVRWIRTYGNVLFKNVIVGKYRILANYSTRPEVIKSSIDKCYELRMKIFNEEPNLIGIDKLARLTRKIEEHTANINWKAGHQVSLLQTLKILLLKVRWLLLVKAKI